MNRIYTDERGDFAVCRCCARIDVEFDPEPDEQGNLRIVVTPVNGARIDGILRCRACAAGVAA